MSKKKSQTNETTDQIIKHIRAAGGYVWRNNTTGIFDPASGNYRPTNAKKGASDIIGGIPVRLFRQRPPIAHLLCVEVKTGKDKLSPEQIGFIASVQHIGGIALVVKDYEDFKEQFKIYENR